jgi:hypothetical protein
MKRMQSTTGMVSRRRIPTRAPSVASDFLVPALTGLYLGVSIGMLFGFIFWLASGYFWMPFGIFLSTFMAGAFVWRSCGLDRTVWATEDIRRAPGEPEPEPMAMPALPEPHAPILLNGYAGKERAEAERLTEDQERLAAFIRGCEFDTSALYWRNREPRYAEYRNLLIGGGWALWRDKNNKRAGWELNPNVDVEDIIAEVHRHSPTPDVV